jgi:iron complex outermembrane receptor protein
MQNQKVLSNLKLRLGWGKTGQQDINMGDYPYMGTYTLNSNGQSQYWRNGGWSALLKPNAYNPDLKWETTTTWNIGLDYGFIDNRINGSIDWYYRKTTDLINAEAKVPAGTNFAEFVVDNIGSLRNTGVEATINFIPVQTKNVTWEIGGNVAYNSNKILELTNSGASTDYRRFGSTGYDGAFQNMVHYVDHPASMFFVYEQVYDEAGRPIEGLFVDQNNDGILDDNDLRPYHTADPNFTYGINTKLQVYNWDFAIAGHGSAGNWVYNGIASNNSEVGPASIYANQYLRNRVTDATNTYWGMKKVLSDYYVQNAAFFRIDNITLGYTFQNLFGAKTSGRVYAVCQNPFVFTKYKGLDPEVAGGIDLDVYPRPVSFQLGVNLNF